MEQFLETIEKSRVIYLSTHKAQKAIVRPVSPVRYNQSILIRTSELSSKVAHIRKDPNVSGVCEDFHFEGTAYILGKINAPENRELKQQYLQKFPDAFSSNDMMLTQDDIFIEIKIKNISSL
ncbi:pyridoxamine 5'-phosphate oxidase family protein [Listeria costaricensis]|uniref:pyridoxamine 5'-phosphate oxidase family protein n=1 Tax=Listeria costaricensis TaxID=2026604 RepID=UPI000C06C1AB|nr:pyridoxamine 5'-phosphate oxidase family protein [Listeria costaricensis]